MLILNKADGQSINYVYHMGYNFKTKHDKNDQIFPEINGIIYYK